MGRRATANVPCPHCGYAYSKQKASTFTEGYYRRTRLCLKAEGCGRQFVTYEVYPTDVSLLRVVKHWYDKNKVKDNNGR